MSLKFLGRGGSGVGECPSLFVGESHYVVQGWVTEDPGTVEIPHLLLGFAEADTFLGARMTDTGRGTFTLSGRPVVEPEVLAQLELAEGEAVVEVPKLVRSFYGVAAAR
ncbi:hypothetical protein [Nocardia blacklockiae]|uniref:hypothetical protein n=1 Tax=Nocardia blacklockiae TaxID=480036 RepID=UPI001893BDB5|nr:hypothetical protein [Nocardia blacklockiae]MBF6175467.1 hypothetical protein [Nocardia blacklockiae]